MALTGYRQSVFTPYTPASITSYPREYFGGCDVSIFFRDTSGNEQYIDEIRDIEFSLEERVIPVYGYASYTAQKVVHGCRIIQGSFTINMRAGDYLHEMLYQATASSAVSNAGSSSTAVTSSTSANLLAGSTAIAPDPFSNPAGFALWQQQQIATFWQEPQVSALLTPKDLSRQAYFLNSGFTIVLVYGDIDTIDLSRNTGRVRTIENVHPMSAQQMISLNGENITERWTFMATDMNSGNRQDFDGYAQ